MMTDVEYEAALAKAQAGMDVWAKKCREARAKYPADFDFFGDYLLYQAL